MCIEWFTVNLAFTMLFCLPIGRKSSDPVCLLSLINYIFNKQIKPFYPLLLVVVVGSTMEMIQW